MELNEALLLPCKNDVKNAIRATDIYNVVKNKRSTVFNDLLESISTVLALTINDMRTAGQHNMITTYCTYYAHAIAQAGGHYAMPNNLSTQMFVEEANRIIDNPETFINKASKLEEKYQELANIQDEIKKLLLGAVTHGKIDAPTYVLIGEHIGGVKFRRESIDQFSCNKKDFNLLTSIIDLKDLPVKVRCETQ